MRLLGNRGYNRLNGIVWGRKGGGQGRAGSHNCHSGLEDMVDYYKLGTHVKFISDILYEVIEKPQ